MILTENKRCYICNEKVGMDYYLIGDAYMCSDCGKKMVEHLSGDLNDRE